MIPQNKDLGIMLTILHETILYCDRPQLETWSDSFLLPKINDYRNKPPTACYLSSLFGFKLTSISCSFKEITTGVLQSSRIYHRYSQPGDGSFYYQR